MKKLKDYKNKILGAFLFTLSMLLIFLIALSTTEVKAQSTELDTYKLTAEFNGSNTNANVRPDVFSLTYETDYYQDNITSINSHFMPFYFDNLIEAKIISGSVEDSIGNVYVDLLDVEKIGLSGYKLKLTDDVFFYVSNTGNVFSSLDNRYEESNFKYNDLKLEFTYELPKLKITGDLDLAAAIDIRNLYLNYQNKRLEYNISNIDLNDYNDKSINIALDNHYIHDQAVSNDNVLLHDNGNNIHKVDTLTLKVENGQINIYAENILTSGKTYLRFIPNNYAVVSVEKANAITWRYFGPNALEISQYLNWGSQDLHESRFYFDEELTELVPLDYDYQPGNLYEFYWGLNLIKNDYVVHFDSRGGSAIDQILVPFEETDNNYNVDFFNKGIEIPIPEKEGYNFIRWEYLDSFGNPQRFTDRTKLNEENYLYAVWEEHQEEYTVTISINDSMNYPRYQYLTVSHGEKVPFQDYIPLKSGYRFIGWGVGSWSTDLVEYDFNLPVVNDFTISAMFAAATKANITFISNGGTSFPTTEFKFGVADYPIPERAYDAFLGWYLDEELTVEAPASIGRYNVYHYDLTLYAKWQENSGYLYFEMNGAPEISPILHEYGALVSLPTHPPIRNGYIFTGWYYDNELTSLIKNTDYFTYDTPTTIYAGWELDPEYEGPIDKNEDVISNETLEYILYGFLGIMAVMIVSAIFFPKKKGRRR